MINPDLSKACEYYKAIIKMTHIIESKRLNTTIWAQDYSTSQRDPQIITKTEIRKRARIIRRRIKKKLSKIEKKYSPKVIKKVKDLALYEMSRGY